MHNFLHSDNQLKYLFQSQTKSNGNINPILNSSKIKVTNTQNKIKLNFFLSFLSIIEKTYSKS